MQGPLRNITKRPNGIFRRFWRDSAGAVAATYALALPALVAVSAVGFDYARMASLDTELQNAADQATLAAATQLDKTFGSQTRAIAAASGLVANDTRFANDGAGMAVAVAQVRFFESAANAEAGTNGFNNPSSATDDGRAAFVRVTVVTRRANYALTPIVGAFFNDVANNAAVAGVGSALCRTPPVMMCNPSEPVGNANTGLDFNASAHVGQGFLVTQGGGGAWTPGNFGYLDTGGGPNAPAVMSALGWNSPPGDCVAQNGVNTVDTATGNMATVPDALNTRFDIYETNACQGTGTCSPSINSRKDMVRAANASGNNSCKVHNQGWQEVANSEMYRPGTNAALNQAITDAAWPVTSMGHPRDICHSTASNNCPGDGIFGDAFWDRDAYFRSHYRRSVAGAGGAANSRWSAAQWRANLSANGFTGTIDPVGTTRPTRPTRYEIYQWEIEKRGQTIDGVVILARNPASATGNTQVNHGQPICSASQTPSMGSGVVPATNLADRRRISVAVVNCSAHGVNGRSRGVPVRRWMDVFLVQPSIDRKNPNNITRKDQIYVEVIGETAAGANGETAGTVIRRDQPFLLR